MADTKISALPADGTITGIEELASAQGGVSSKITVDDILDYVTSIRAASIVQGTCILARNSATEIQIGVGVLPLKLSSGWTSRAVTAAVTKSNGSLSTSTIYYVYAADSAGSTVLELSTTVHVQDADYGVRVKSGDPTRTYVGVVKTDGSSQFTADLTNPWFGAPKTWSLSSTGSNTTSGSFVDVTNSTITVLPHSSTSTFKVHYSCSAAVTNIGATNTDWFGQLSQGGTIVTNSGRLVDSPSAAGGVGSSSSVAWTFIGSPATASAVIYKLQHAASNSATATTSSILAYIEEIR